MIYLLFIIYPSNIQNWAYKLTEVMTFRAIEVISTVHNMPLVHRISFYLHDVGSLLSDGIEKIASGYSFL
jgi:hypothetical protein